MYTICVIIGNSQLDYLRAMSSLVLLVTLYEKSNKSVPDLFFSFPRYIFHCFRFYSAKTRVYPFKV